MYTKEFLEKQIAENGGDPSRIMVMHFNNAYTKHFFSEDFDWKTMYDEATDMFKFTEQDARRRRYVVYKPLEYLEGVSFTIDDNTKDDYDPLVVRG